MGDISAHFRSSITGETICSIVSNVVIVRKYTNRHIPNKHQISNMEVATMKATARTALKYVHS